MARVASQSLGGYFKTPTHLLSRIADLIKVTDNKLSLSAVDPCAADGEAVYEVCNFLVPIDQHKLTIYACEMEKTRFESLKSRQYGSLRFRLEAVHGDAMRVTWDMADHHVGASLLYGNPPYDSDREHKRLEEKFLVRFAPCLAPQGVLVWIVPYYALAASADTLARHFVNLHCYRFPDEDFAVFKQIVLVGEKKPELFEPDPIIRAEVLRWSESVDGMPVLGSERHVVEVSGQSYSGFSKWAIAPLDVRGALAQIKPWSATDRAGRHHPIPGVTPDPSVGRYPMAVPPKPAHLAAAIASGVFNGAEIVPEKPGRPRLRVKGTFDKEFVTTEEKKDKEGTKTGEVQVQQPKLVVTVLDTEAGTYHTLKSSPEATNAPRPADMSTGDLLTHYGRSLMAVMRAQCPVLHDPHADTDRFAMPSFARPLYKAQEESARALVKLLGGPNAKSRQGRTAFLLGEIGVGKSGTFVATAAAIGAMRVLITAPPHLMRSWVDQVAALLPDVPVNILETVDDVDAFCSNPAPEMHFAVMSRSAKLMHRWDGVSHLTNRIRHCPGCGENIPVDKDGIEMTAAELASKRKRHGLKRTPEGKWVADGTQRKVPAGPLARAARDLAEILMLAAPSKPAVNQLVRGRTRDKIMVHAHNRGDKQAAWIKARPNVARVLNTVAHEMLSAGREKARNIGSALLGLLAALNDERVTAELVERVYVTTSFDAEDYGTGAEARAWCRNALLLLKQPGELAERLKAMGLHSRTSYAGGLTATVWGSWEMRAQVVASGKDDPESYHTGIMSGTWNKHHMGSVDCAVEALTKLTALGAWVDAEPCGEWLYQAVPEPRKVSLSAYLARKYPKTIDLLGVDEAHEVGGNSDSAQSQSEHRLVSLGMPVVMLTGSVMNGYAKSLFANQWGMDPKFREEFPRGDETGFNRRYGYIKQLVQMKDGEGKVIEWGANSDRKQTTAKEIGYAPGVLPLFLLRYLLRIAVTLHKSDLALDLPPHVETVSYVDADSEVMGRYKTLLETLKSQIKKDRFDPIRGNMLFGMLSELPSYLDRATVDCGNREDGSFVVAYPENPKLEGDSGRVLASFPGLPASTVLAKEKWMLETVEAKLKAGRRVMLFGWHEAVLPRLSRLVERELGEPCALLQAAKVQASKRQTWIDEKVINPKRRVLAVNGAAVQTGLNNLVWFQDAIWFQNPGVNPIVYRQATGRIDRIGKTAQTESLFAVYDGTAQALAAKLLHHKVAVSMATDGLDADGALQAAGVGSTEATDAFSVGRALYEMMERGDAQTKPAKPVKNAESAVGAAVPVKGKSPVQLSLF